jgi:hypothetical protein
VVVEPRRVSGGRRLLLYLVVGQRVAHDGRGPGDGGDSRHGSNQTWSASDDGRWHRSILLTA